MNFANQNTIGQIFSAIELRQDITALSYARLTAILALRRKEKQNDDEITPPATSRRADGSCAAVKRLHQMSSTLGVNEPINVVAAFADIVAAKRGSEDGDAS